VESADHGGFGGRIDISTQNPQAGMTAMAAAMVQRNNPRLILRVKMNKKPIGSG